jgi:predicted phosphohydrolase
MPGTGPDFSTSALQALTSAAPFIAVIASLLAILALIYATVLEKRLSRLTLGRTGSLEETMNILSRDMKDMQVFKNEVERYLKLVEQRLRGSVSGVGVVRFNPFSTDGQGGNQSFATAFLDEEANGVVFSTLYARNHVGVYAKPVQKGISSYELSDEEKRAIVEAKQSIATHKKE